MTGIGVACEVVAPSLVPVRAGDRVETDRRDAKRLVRLQRAGLLRFVVPPTAETEGLRDLLGCRDDLRCARTAAQPAHLAAVERVLSELALGEFDLRVERVVQAQVLSTCSRSCAGSATSASQRRPP